MAKALCNAVFYVSLLLFAGKALIVVVDQSTAPSDYGY